MSKRRQRTASDSAPIYGGMDHLRDELVCLDLRLMRLIFELRADAEHDNGERGAGGLYVSHREVDRLLQIDDSPTLPHLHALEGRIRDCEERIAKRMQAAVMLPLLNLMQRLGLATLERQILITCLAPELDRKYDRLYAYVQDDITRRRPSLDLVLRLYYAAGEDRWTARRQYSPNTLLVRLGLVYEVYDPHSPSGSSDLATLLQLDRRVCGFLLGNTALDAELSSCATLISPAAHAHTAEFGAEPTELARFFTAHPGTIVQLCGPQPVALQFAIDTGRQFQQTLIHADAELLAAAPALIKSLLRECLLQDSLLLLRNPAALSSSPTVAAIWNSLLPPAVQSGLRMLVAGDLPVGRHVGWSQLPAATLELRRSNSDALQANRRTILAAHGFADQSIDPSAAARCFDLMPYEIEQAIKLAHTQAAVRGEIRPNTDDLIRSCRQVRATALPPGMSLRSPRRAWEDLVLPDATAGVLREICAQIAFRDQVLFEWGYNTIMPDEQGLAVLFSGPPGTGKSLAAEVIAGELQYDLYVVDLAQIISKYIGETEKHLEQVFQQIELVPAVLLIDEADALFGKRTAIHDAHDRYANIETSYLLQRIERFSGIAILTTNLRDNLDAAFARRLRFLVDFSLPDEVQRRRIWQRHLPPQAPLAPEVDLNWLANRFDLSGGSIKNIALRAAFLAAAAGSAISNTHLLAAARSEYETLGRTWEAQQLGLNGTVAEVGSYR